MDIKVKSLIHTYSTGISVSLITICFLLNLYNDFFNTVPWYDEAYTMAMMDYSFSEIWKITASDVHPPLYYYMLKLFCNIFGDSQNIMRIFSNLGIIASLILGLFPIRRLFGKNISLIYILVLVLLPVTQYLGVEIRMYSWAMFFVSGCSIYAYESYLNGKLISFSKMAIYGICAAYTHYYALVAIGIILVLLWISSLKRQEKIIRLILFSLFIILAYIPWIPVLIMQVNKVSHAYWIETPTLKDLLLFCYYFFSPKEPSHPYMIFSLPVMSIALSIMLLFILIFIIYIIKAHLKKISEKLIYADGFISIYILTLLVTLIISFTILPIIVPRYTCCILGPLVIGIAIYLTEIYNNKNKAVIITLFTLVLTFSIARFFSEKAYYQMKNDEAKRIEYYFKENENETNVIVANLKSYPELAKINNKFPTKKCILLSTEKINYLPFLINVKENIDNLSDFFIVEAINDTFPVPTHYVINNKLELKDLNIILVEKERPSYNIQ